MQTTFVLDLYLYLASLKPGWPVGKSIFNENTAISLDLGLGLRLKVCQQTKTHEWGLCPIDNIV